MLIQMEYGKHRDKRNNQEYESKLLEYGIINCWNMEDNLVKSFKVKLTLNLESVETRLFESSCDQGRALNVL